MSTSKLFTPVKVGRLELGHRIVMAPLTRFRANSKHVHGALAVEYYSQRANTPGTLLITEATLIAEEAGGYRNVPGIWNEEQIAGWKQVTDAVHAKKSFIFLQLWALGRTADPNVLTEEGNYSYVSSGSIGLTGTTAAPRPLTVEEIKKYVSYYTTAALDAMKAGFDGVEVHAANGYLIDQFIQSVSNNRTDEYGGSVENRARFALEVVDAVTKAVGADKTGIRFSPWSEYQDMREPHPEETFSYLVSALKDDHPDLAYIHVIEPRILGDSYTEGKHGDSNDFIRDIWQPRPLILAGGFSGASATEAVEEKGGLVAFGRHFIANPDLPRRIYDNVPLNAYNRATFYTTESPVGYIDQPFAI